MTKASETPIEKTVREFITSVGVLPKIEPAGAGIMRDGWECDGWRVTLGKGKTIEGFDYYTGIGHRARIEKIPRHIATQSKNAIGRIAWEAKHIVPVTPPIASVLHALVLDSSARHESFNDWCASWGYDNDSIKAFKIYTACLENAEKLARIFTREQLETLRDLLQDY